MEEIEQAFIPPDITADMTDDWDFELDEDWDNFLKEFTQPLTQEPFIEDDPEADPEYNILEDEETDLCMYCYKIILYILFSYFLSCYVIDL